MQCPGGIYLYHLVQRGPPFSRRKIVNENVFIYNFNTFVFIIIVIKYDFQYFLEAGTYRGRSAQSSQMPECVLSVIARVSFPLRGQPGDIKAELIQPNELF